MKYKKNFVNTVICRVDFPEISALKSQEPTDFHSEIIELFPRIEKGLEAQLSTKDSSGLTIKEQLAKWTMSNKEKDKKITLSQKNMILEFLKYNNYDDFKSTWDEVFRVLLLKYSITFFDRLGLRYINRVSLEKGNPLIWKNYINNKLIAGLGFCPDMASDVVRSMHQIIFNKNGKKIIFNYGIWNDNYPDAPSLKHFMLDYDCFIDSPIEAAEISNKIKEFIDIIYYLFEKSIEDKLRDIMGREDA